MADWYFAPATGANPSDPTKHPINGVDGVGRGTSPSNPVTFEYALNTLRSSGDTLWAYPSTVPNVRASIPPIVLSGSSYVFQGNWPGGTTYIRSLAAPHYMSDPFGDGETYERATDRHIIIAGINVVNSHFALNDLEDVMFQLEGAIDAPPDAVAGETWATKLGANYQSIGLQWRQLFGSQNVSYDQVFRLKRCAFRLGVGPTWAAVDVNYKYPEFNSTEWGDSAPDIYNNNWYYAPVGITTTRGGEITLNDCRFEDINSGIQCNLRGTGKVVVKNCWMRRIYQDFSSVGDADENAIGAAFLVEFYGCIFQDCFGHINDRFGPHCDGDQVYLYFDSVVGSNDNPVLAPGPLMVNCMFVITGRATATGHYVQGAHDGANLYAVYINPRTRGCIFIGCRDAIQVPSASLTSKSASWFSEMRRNIVVMPTDQLSIVTSSGNYTIATPQTSPTRGIAAQYCTDNIFEVTNISPQTTARNNTNAGIRGGTINYTNIFQGAVTIAANGNSPKLWWDALQRKPAYASKGPQGYSSLKEWLEDNDLSDGDPYPAECVFPTAEEVLTGQTATSVHSLVITNQIGDTVPFVPGSGVEWLELAAYDRSARGGVPNKFAVTGSTGTFTQTAHGIVANTALRVVSRTRPMTGISTTATYYAVNVTTNTLQLSATSGGSAITSVNASDLVALLVPASMVTQDWSSSAGTVTGGRYIVQKAAASALPATQVRYTSTIDGRATNWAITTASNNVFPGCSFPTLHRFQRTNSSGSGISNSNYFGMGFMGIMGGAGVAKGLSGFLTGAVGPWQIFFTNTNTLRVRIRNTAGTQICDIDFGTVDRTGTVVTGIFLVVDITQADQSTGVYAYKYTSTTGQWSRIGISAAWSNPYTAPIWFAYTAQPTQIFGLNDFTTLTRMDAFFITNELIDVLDDPVNPAILSKFKPDWVGEFFEGFTGNRPPIAFVGKADDLNVTNPVNRGYVTNWVQFSTGGTPNSCVAVTAQVWPVVLTLTSEMVSSISLDGAVTTFLVRPVGFANAATITPSIAGTPQTGVAMPKGTGGVSIDLNLTGPATRSVTFANNSIHTDPAALSVTVYKRYPNLTLSKADALTATFAIDVGP